MRPKPAILVILDGWGVAPPGEGNPIAKAKTPNMDKLITSYPAMTLTASGNEVGLCVGEAGNSETGHLNIGAGRVFYQILPRINKAIEDKSFLKNEAFLGAIEHARKNKGNIHIMGLVSSGGVHSHEDHLYALLDLAKSQKIKKVFVHAFLDGKDTIYNSGKGFIEKLQDKMKKLNLGKIATLSGRFYAMDRDGRFERTEKAYSAIAKGIGKKSTNALKAIEQSYKEGVFDEEFIPTFITDRNGKPLAKVEDGDAVIFFNFRADRSRQLTNAFVLDNFSGFKRIKKQNIFFVAMTEYEKELPLEVAFFGDAITEPLARALSDDGLRQLHIAETEKYAHVTFFLNGQQEEQFQGEDRVVIPSPHVASYDKKPEMSAREITTRVIKEIKAENYDFIVVNFANADMVGHTGNFEATKKGIEILDKCVGDIAEQTLLYGGVVFITADHGNAEEIANLHTGRMDKEHTTNPVPFIIVGEKFEGQSMGLPEGVGADLSLVPPVGFLGDVAPTILHVLGIKQPKKMTGNSLI
ncbi:MAG: 2,3-bisphosphoglycerate-independent phosphoglycerate mutase [Parcubacteria group bacterium CG10_big_fil_rev_8_21_14_0_10_36_14]|nr:MAG: 2,3-bisphosphoglycerate-independent phosphoglycerate mutase [Parcubacteria group bacterium CG10_big_fil_rev_8_21_14_0_10_36_14]